MIYIRFLMLLTLIVIQLDAANANPLKVGVVLPLSGPFATYGDVARKGFELAEQENPGSFRDVKFLYEDSKYDGKDSITAYRKLIEQDRVDLVFVWGVTPAEVLAPIAKSSRIPTILYTLNKKIHENNRWVIRAKSTYEQFGKKLSDYLATKGQKRLAVFKIEVPFYNDMFEAFKAASIQNGQTILYLENFSPDQLDFRSSISKLKRSDVDAVGVYLIPGQIAQFYRQMAEQGLKVPTFGTEDIGTKSEIERAPSQMEGAVFTANVVAATFRDSFLKRYENDTNIWHAAQTYDLAQMLTLIQKGSTAEQIVEAFRTVPLRPGALGMPERENAPGGGISFTYPVGIGTIKNGQVVELR